MRRAPRICLLGAFLALALCWAPGNASADRICKVNETPCSEANSWPVGTVFESQIKAGTEVTFKGSGGTEIRCTSSTWAGELTQNYPSNGGAALLHGASETFGGCSAGNLACTSVKASEFWNGAKWFGNPESAGNGYSPLSSPKALVIELKCGLLSCKLEESWTEASTHTYAGGNPASEAWNWRFVRKEGSALLCGSEVFVSGQRVYSAPKGSVYWTVS